MTMKELLMDRKIVMTEGNEVTDQERARAKAELQNTGEGSLNEADGYNCRRCKNRGYYAVVQFVEGFDVWDVFTKACECNKVRDSIRYFNHSGLKPLSEKYTFKNYTTAGRWQKVVKEKAEAFLKTGSAAWFFIGGQSGAGKTHICTAMTVELMRRGHAAKYMLWRDEVTRLKACANDADAYAELMEELKTPAVLYIDDLFKTGKNEEGRRMRPTPADLNAAFELINYRYNQPAQVTIISSEMSLDDIMDIDEAIGGRIKERAGEFVIEIAPDKEKNMRYRGTGEKQGER